MPCVGREDEEDEGKVSFTRRQEREFVPFPRKHPLIRFLFPVTVSGGERKEIHC